MIGLEAGMGRGLIREIVYLFVLAGAERCKGILCAFYVEKQIN
jgi:hypothetical protein